MQNVIDILKLELDMYSGPLLEPKDEIDSKTEKVIGEVPEDLRRLYSVSRHQELQALKLTIDIVAMDSDELRVQAEKLHTHGDLFSKLFWASLREHFSAWQTAVGIRAGWKVVAIAKEKANTQGMNILRKLLGDAFEE